MSKRCAIYTRKSTEEGLELRFNSLEDQHDACLSYIRSQGHDGWLADSTRYDDGGFSGGNLERPALRRLLADIRSGQVDVVVVHKVDRLTRSLMDFARLAELFEANDVAFVSVTQHLNTADSLGRLSLHILLSFAQFERELASERTRDKIIASRRRGLWTGGNPPLGYDADQGALQVNEVEAEIVRFIFARYLVVQSIADLQKNLARSGVVSKTRLTADGKRRGGKTFSRGSLYAMLRNPLYIGKIRCGSEVVEAQHAGIVDSELWQSVQVAMAEGRVRFASRHASADIPLLMGKLFGTDGARVTRSFTALKGKKYQYYVSADSTRADGGDTLRVPCRMLDREVAMAVLAKAAEPGLIRSQVAKSGACIEEISVRSATRRIREDLQQKQNSDTLKWILDTVDRIEVGGDGMTVVLSCQRLLIAILGLSSPTMKMSDADWTLTFTKRIAFGRNGRTIGKLLGAQSGTQRGKAILEEVSRARHWYANLCSGRYRSLSEIAEAESISASTVSRRITLAFLSPKLGEALREGRIPDFVDCGWLHRKCPIPTNWETQHAMIWSECRTELL